jgi:outer membrane protein OmpA-like peptidoglycan-associated protein
MRKSCMLAVIVMLMTVVTVVQAEVRAGGLPEIGVDSSIKNCDCHLFPECCAKQVPAPVKEKATVRLNVRFDTDKAIVKKEYHKDIQTIASLLKLNPDLAVTIEGHTDNVGNDDYNQKLSEKRANSIRQYLIDNFGIKGSRLTAIGYGESKPIASNDTEEGRQINRRVQAVFDITMIRTKTEINVK